MHFLLAFLLAGTMLAFPSCEFFFEPKPVVVIEPSQAAGRIVPDTTEVKIISIYFPSLSSVVDFTIERHTSCEFEDPTCLPRWSAIKIVFSNSISGWVTVRLDSLNLRVDEGGFIGFRPSQAVEVSLGDSTGTDFVLSYPGPKKNPTPDFEMYLNYKPEGAHEVWAREEL